MDLTLLESTLESSVSETISERVRRRGAYQRCVQGPKAGSGKRSKSLAFSDDLESIRMIKELN